MAIDEIDPKGLQAAIEAAWSKIPDSCDARFDNADEAVEAAIRAYLKATETTQIGQQAGVSQTRGHVPDECDD